MSILNYTSVSLGDLAQEALRESGVVGEGMTPRAEQLQSAWSRLQWVLSQWERSRWKVYALEPLFAPSNGTELYTVGLGGDFNLTNVGDFNSDFSNDFSIETYHDSNRPARIESAFFRQTEGVAGAGGASQYIDYPLRQIDDGTDYWSQVRLKSLVSWPQFFYYEAAWPLGKLYVYPAIQNVMGYTLGIVVRRALGLSFATTATLVALPPEYYPALVYSAAMAIRSKYQFPTFPGDMLPKMESQALAVLRKSNTRIPRLQVPRELIGARGRYNIYSDTFD